MADNIRIEFKPDGRIAATEEAAKALLNRMPSDAEQSSRIDEILAMIADPDSSLGAIKRLISAEIAEVTKLITRFSTDEELLSSVRVKNLEIRVKALRELGKELMEADVLGKKDFLNLDGPKFAYVVAEWNEGFNEAMRLVGIDDGTCNSVFRHFRDIMVKREPEIRRNVDTGSFAEKLEGMNKKGMTKGGK